MKRYRPCLTTSSLVQYAREVMSRMGIGHRECVYHRALAAYMANKDIRFRSEVTTPIMFMGECVGTGRADIVLDDMVIEIKAVARCPSKVSGQLRKYMESLRDIEKKECVGVVLNFNQSTGGIEVAEDRLDPPATKTIKRSRFFPQPFSQDEENMEEDQVQKPEHPAIMRARENFQLAARKLKQTMREYNNERVFINQ